MIVSSSSPSLCISKTLDSERSVPEKRMQMGSYKVMILDLWGPPFTQEFYYCLPQEPSSGFCFENQHDMMVEDALNEEACLQVLRRWINRADTEIEELEEKLVLLQNQLAWAENKEWPDICAGTMKQKISSLDVSLSNLRLEMQKDSETGLSSFMLREPVEGIHEILKELLNIQCQEKHMQSSASLRCNGGDINFQVIKQPVSSGNCTSADPTRLESDCCQKKKILNGCHASSTGAEQAQINQSVFDSEDHSSIDTPHMVQDKSHEKQTLNDVGASNSPASKTSIQNSCLKPEEKRQDHLEVLQPADKSGKDCSSPPKFATEDSYEGHCSATVTVSSSDIVEKGAKVEGQVKPTGSSVQGSSVVKYETRHLNELTMICFDSKIVKEEIEERCAVIPVFAVVDLSMGGKGAELQQVKRESTTTNTSKLDALAFERAYEYKENILTNSISKNIDNKGMRSNSSASSCISMSSSNPIQNQTNHLTSAESIVVSKSANPSQASKDYYANLKPNEGEAHQSDKIFSSEQNRQNELQIVKCQEPTLVRSERPTTASDFKVKEHSGENRLKPHTKMMQTSHPKGSQEVKLAADKKAGQNMLVMPQVDRVKRRLQSSQKWLKPGFLQEEDETLSAALEAVKKRKKLRIANKDQPPPCGGPKILLQGFHCEAKETFVTSSHCSNAVLALPSPNRIEMGMHLPLKVIKVSEAYPTTTKGKRANAGSTEKMTNERKKALQIIEQLAVDDSSKWKTLQSCQVTVLKCIAKALRITNFSKHRKEGLVKVIAETSHNRFVDTVQTARSELK